jgi:hypothetical protein
MIATSANFSSAFCFLLFEATFIKKESHKKSKNSLNQGFSYCFCWKIEESGVGSVPRTSGSGFATLLIIV